MTVEARREWLVEHGPVGRHRVLLAALENEDVHRVYAGISIPNPASVALHRRFGFRAAAYFSQQGRKFDRYWDVAWFEKRMST